MKKFFFVSLFLGIFLSATAATAVEPVEPVEKPGNEAVASVAETLETPLFTLENQEGDSPALLKKKAALRLFKAYSVTLTRLNNCKAQHPEADKAGAGFGNRNGNTLSTVMLVIKQSGGLSPEIKAVMDEQIALESAAETPPCPALIQAVNKGERDIYKAPDYAADYKLVRAR